MSKVSNEMKPTTLTQEQVKDAQRAALDAIAIYKSKLLRDFSIVDLLDTLLSRDEFKDFKSEAYEGFLFFTDLLALFTRPELNAMLPDPENAGLRLKKVADFYREISNNEEVFADLCANEISCGINPAKYDSYKRTETYFLGRIEGVREEFIADIIKARPVSTSKA